MNAGQWNPIQKRNVIIGMAAAMFLLALLTKPSSLMMLTSKIGLFEIILSCILGFVFAVGVSQCGEQALSSPVQPWYARPCSLGFIAILIGAFLVFWLFIGRPFFGRSTPMPRDELSGLFALIGWTLTWIVLLAWVSCEKDCD